MKALFSGALDLKDSSSSDSDAGAETETKKTFSERYTGAKSLQTPRQSSRRSRRKDLHLQSNIVVEIVEEDEADNTFSSKIKRQTKLSTPQVNSVGSALTAREAVSD